MIFLFNIYVTIIKYEENIFQRNLIFIMNIFYKSRVFKVSQLFYTLFNLCSNFPRMSKCLLLIPLFIIIFANLDSSMIFEIKTNVTLNLTICYNGGILK